LNAALRLLIRIYWAAVPPVKRRRCLFGESCSRFVYSQATGGRPLSGLQALRYRLSRCRPGYLLLRARDRDGAGLVRLANGDVVRLDTMSAAVREQLGGAIAPYAASAGDRGGRAAA
jgi:hypothetical protein